ncbi:MAG: hypothetical protein ABJP48_01625 [Erythrobacter sp.]
MMGLTQEELFAAAVIVFGIPLMIWDIRRRWNSGKTEYFGGDGGGD